ncbi:MAG: single-stranded-DNA-specific exonuclease RecJ [Candidatus Paceibacterota bacterium]
MPRLRPLLTQPQRLELSKYSDVIAHLLFHRGLETAEKAQKFLEPDYSTDIHDPFLLKDAEKAAGLVIEAIKSKKRITIYADYDADGIPGAALFTDFLKRIGFKNFAVYIPHRHDEGFGLNEDAVEKIVADKSDLLITIDCGITDVVAVKKAKKAGLIVIITDHHEPPEELPPADAIIDHRQADCAYPDKNLCGSGVAFKLIQAILKKERFGLGEGQEKWLLDLVGLATMSDMVPLTGENRVLAYYGMNVLRKSPRKGLMELLRKLKINQRTLSEDDVAFMITPRINAASRMGLPMDAYSLLVADNETDARFYADHLDKINNERKGVVASLVKEVKKLVHERHGSAMPAVIVLGNPLWRPSLLGLVANSCAEEFNRPVFLWGRDGDDVIKGSCRSEGQSSVVALMRSVSVEVFSQFGGHHHSGGFAVSNEQIHFLEVKLNEGAKKIKEVKEKARADLDKAKDGNGLIVEETGLDDDNENEQIIDSELKLDDLTPQFFEDLSKLAPFGMGNPKPLFLFKNVVPKVVRTFGKAQDHVSLTFSRTNGREISAISFFGAANDWAKILKTGDKIDLVATPEKSYFGGRVELRLRVEGVERK